MQDAEGDAGDAPAEIYATKGNANSSVCAACVDGWMDGVAMATAMRSAGRSDEV